MISTQATTIILWTIRRTGSGNQDESPLSECYYVECITTKFPNHPCDILSIIVTAICHVVDALRLRHTWIYLVNEAKSPWFVSEQASFLRPLVSFAMLTGMAMAGAFLMTANWIISASSRS